MILMPFLGFREMAFFLCESLFSVDIKKREVCHNVKSLSFVIQTTIGRKTLNGIKDVFEILRFALDVNMVERIYYDAPTSVCYESIVVILQQRKKCFQ